jgi:hypothetical protein
MDHELGAAHIAAADRRIAQAEARLVHLREILAELEHDHHARAATEGRKLVANFEGCWQRCAAPAPSGRRCIRRSRQPQEISVSL